MDDAAHPEQLVPDTNGTAQEETQHEKRKTAAMALVGPHLDGRERHIRGGLLAAKRDSIYNVAAHGHQKIQDSRQP